jgi:UDP-N-acetyl-D-glucosamine dehydrogenase
MTMKAPGKVVVIGQGYVGLPVAVAAFSSGHTVVGIDLDPGRVDILQRGESPIEDVDSEIVRSAIERNVYIPTSDYSEASGFSVAVVTVPTPLKDGAPDLSFIESAARSLSPHISEGSLVILESTTYPGTTEELLAPILEAGSSLVAGENFLLGYSPERIDPGNKKWNLLNTPKVISGVNQKSLEQIKKFYSGLGITTVEVSGTREAEMTKLLENTFRHVNVALVNELAHFSDGLGVNIWEAIDAASTKPFGYMRFTPGPGVGGHCLPIDPSYLSWAIKETSGSDFRFVSLANDVNNSMPSYVVKKAAEILEQKKRRLEESTIILLGLAYKGSSGDTRESPALRVAELLKERGCALSAVDDFVAPYSWPSSIERFSAETLKRADLAILLTDHPTENYEQALSVSEAVLDTRNVLEGSHVVRI